jgi:hypothetical protein
MIEPPSVVGLRSAKSGPRCSRPDFLQTGRSSTAVDDDRRAGTGQPFRGGSGDDRLAALEFDIHVVSFQLLRRQQVRERLVALEGA